MRKRTLSSLADMFASNAREVHDRFEEDGYFQSTSKNKKNGESSVETTDVPIAELENGNNRNEETQVMEDVEDEIPTILDI